MGKYTETEMPEGNLEDAALTALAGGNHYLFIVASDAADNPDGFNVRLATSLPDSGTARRLLEETLAAMPESEGFDA